MVTIAAGILPPPHSVALADGTVVHRSSIGRFPFFQMPDPALNPARLQLGWQDVPGAVADAIDRLYCEHTHELFTFVMPRTGEQWLVQLVGPPVIQWSSAAFASSVTLEVELATAHE